MPVSLRHKHIVNAKDEHDCGKEQHEPLPLEPEGDCEDESNKREEEENVRAEMVQALHRWHLEFPEDLLLLAQREHEFVKADDEERKRDEEQQPVRDCGKMKGEHKSPDGGEKESYRAVMMDLHIRIMDEFV